LIRLVVDLPGSAFQALRSRLARLGHGLLASVGPIFGSLISISVYGGHDVRATRESLGGVQWQLARRAFSLARRGMLSRRWETEARCPGDVASSNCAGACGFGADPLSDGLGDPRLADSGLA
jgi:hypothetical protein